MSDMVTAESWCLLLVIFMVLNVTSSQLQAEINNRSRGDLEPLVAAYCLFHISPAYSHHIHTELSLLHHNPYRRSEINMNDLIHTLLEVLRPRVEVRLLC